MQNRHGPCTDFVRACQHSGKTTKVRRLQIDQIFDIHEDNIMVLYDGVQDVLLRSLKSYILEAIHPTAGRG